MCASGPSREPRGGNATESVSGSPTRQAIRVFVVCGVRLYLEGLCESLERRDGIEIAGAAADVGKGELAIHRPPTSPDVVLLDVGEPGGIDAARQLLDVLPAVPVIAISVPDNELDVIACAETGVSGFLTAESSIDDLVAALESVARGDLLCSPAMAAQLLKPRLEVPDKPSPEERKDLEAEERRLTERVHKGTRGRLPRGLERAGTLEEEVKQLEEGSKEAKLLEGVQRDHDELTRKAQSEVPLTEREQLKLKGAELQLELGPRLIIRLPEGTVAPHTVEGWAELGEAIDYELALAKLRLVRARLGRRPAKRPPRPPKEAPPTPKFDPKLPT
jgi:two-component system, NarL family, nitrate/nitrite response regulator NarL